MDRQMTRVDLFHSLLIKAAINTGNFRRRLRGPQGGKVAALLPDTRL